MKPQIYRALIKGTNIEIKGYLAQLADEDIVMFVSEYSMPNSIHRGTFKIEENTIEKI